MLRLITLLVLSLAGLNAASLPANFTESQVAGGLASPTAMDFSPDGRLFVCQQSGQVRVVKNGSLLPTPFVTVTVDASGERGLLGVAFHPNFASTPYVYIYYTVPGSPAHNRVSRYLANGDVSQGSEEIILELENLSGATNHNGGAIHFGPDGKLYVAVGDNANSANAQTLSNRLGKMLRINPDGTIPADNPFYNTATGVNRSIWALGLRNPFTFALQPGSTRMFINDVGQNSWEEINDGIAGTNYDWPNSEGYNALPPPANPLYAYPHSGGSVTGCAITGGTFYNPSTVQFPSEHLGKYFFADLCGGWIRQYDTLADALTSWIATGISNLVDLKVGPDGKLYYLARGGGVVFKIEHTGSQAPQITQHPQDQTVSAGQSATFTVAASGAPPLSYQWRRNGASIGGATSSSYTLSPATLGDNGAQFDCVLTNSAGSATSNIATLTVTSNQPPTGAILSPAAGALYSGGQTINFSGSGTDPEDGALAAGAFNWRIDLHHDTHTHPAMPPASGVTSGSYTIPTSGETSASVWYRVHLTVTDSAGLTHASFRDVLPRTSVMSFTTSPAGLQITLDGQPLATPANATGVVGILRTLGVVSPQTVGTTTYAFDSWSDGGAATHQISTPAVNTTYTATFHINRRVGTGTGLTATYYDNMNFTGATAARVDPVVAFDWPGSPAPGIGADTFSVRWTGQVQPQFSQTYTFYTTSDDGVRLWINGQLIVNNWTDHTPTENSGSIAMKNGKKYSVVLELYDNTGSATARLSWSSPSTPQQIVPSTQLYP